MNGYKNGYATQSISFEDVEDTVEYLRCRTQVRPDIAIVCGSGVGGLADTLHNKQVFSYKDIPHFLVSTVPGHSGRLIFGELGGKKVVCMQGRFHGYEGYHMSWITLPIRVMASLGAKVLIVTNSCGGLNPEYEVGDIMIIKDHINLPGLAGINPLVGSVDERFGPRFVPLSDAYHKKHRDLAMKVASDLSMPYVKEGVYVVQTGPCFETVTEGRLLRLLGADVTGMSSVPEVIVARQVGQEVMGISLVTNKCITEFDDPVTATLEEVLETGHMRAKDMETFITSVVQSMEIPL